MKKNKKVKTKKNKIKRKNLTRKISRVAQASEWPGHREILYKPERLEYVRNNKVQNSCVFCESRENEMSRESLCVHKGEHAMVILNKYPYNAGHALVLPKRHCADLAELSEAEFLEINSLIFKIVKLMKTHYRAPGINIGLNMGEAAGAGIPGHLHWHIIPRWKGDTNFFPLIAGTKVIPVSLDDVYKFYSQYFNGEN